MKKLLLITLTLFMCAFFTACDTAEAVDAADFAAEAENVVIEPMPAPEVTPTPTLAPTPTPTPDLAAARAGRDINTISTLGWNMSSLAVLPDGGLWFWTLDDDGPPRQIMDGVISIH